VLAVEKGILLDDDIDQSTWHNDHLTDLAAFQDLLDGFACQGELFCVFIADAWFNQDAVA